MLKSSIPSHYHTKKDRPDFKEHELDVENVEVESEPEENDIKEVKIKLPVLVGHLEGGYKNTINTMMDKMVAKGLVDEESKQEKLSF